MDWSVNNDARLLFRGAKLLQVYQRSGKVFGLTVRSCFGSGVWRSEKKWLSADKWKNR